tara:strand:- start:256 stop:393 length:138 start_codon:yes stop_codon:yes gene_type:complete
MAFKKPYMQNGNWYNGYGQKINNPDAYFRAVARNNRFRKNTKTYK